MNNLKFDTTAKEQLQNYVYRLVDPRNLETFYIGRGKGNRVFQHVEDARKLLNSSNDKSSLKINRINDIKASGKEVIHIIQRWGLSLEEAKEVEAALIDVFPGLTNIQSGYGKDRGVITTEDLYDRISAKTYSEPPFDYIIIKTSNEAVTSHGDIYEATRRSWNADLQTAKRYKYVFSVINGIVAEVYEVSNWYQSANGNRIEFNGNVAPKSISSLVKGKRIPAKYRKRGLANPFLYKKK